MRLLLAESDRLLAADVARTLESQRYVVEQSHDGADAQERLRSERYDLVILCASLPCKNGLELLFRLRKINTKVPVLMLVGSADTPELGPKCLDAGADDYLVKPFAQQELDARLRALLRRPSRHSPVLRCGDLEFDSNSRVFIALGKPLPLTPREHAVLEALIREPGRTLSKNDLADTLYTLEDSRSLDAIEIYVHRLRKKLDGCGAVIVTLRGLGYLLRAIVVGEERVSDDARRASAIDEGEAVDASGIHEDGSQPHARTISQQFA
jgi:two-component system, OmpR family, response regulator TctD